MRRTGDVKRTGMNWRLPAIGVAFAALTLLVLAILSDAAGRGPSIALAFVLVVVTAVLLLLDRPRK